eukprot:jgi/Bigna1/63651/fgenesh1_kg.57_\
MGPNRDKQINPNFLEKFEATSNFCTSFQESRGHTCSLGYSYHRRRACSEGCGWDNEIDSTCNTA